jgi:hypothetical protein
LQVGYFFVLRQLQADMRLKTMPVAPTKEEEESKVGFEEPLIVQPSDADREREDSSSSISRSQSAASLRSPPLASRLHDAQQTLFRLNRTLMRHHITILSIALSAIPWISLNLYAVEIARSSTSSSGSPNWRIILSLLFSLVSLGSKLQSCLEYPMNKTKQAQARLTLCDLQVASAAAGMKP